MKKVLLSTLVMLSLLVSVQAQDIITTKDGKDIQAKILEITTSEIKYKKFNNQDGPTFTLEKSEVLIVRYQNGENEIFNTPRTAGTSHQPNTNSPITEGMRYKEYRKLYDYHKYTPQLTDPYSPGWAGVASFFIPGLGQGICGEWGRGLAYFGASALCTTGMLLSRYYTSLLISSACLLTCDIMCIVDAVHVAKIKNMYYQDLRGFQTNINFSISPYLSYTSVPNTSGSIIGLSFSLNF